MGVVDERHDRRALFESVGVDPDAAVNPKLMVPDDDYYAFFERVARLEAARAAPVRAQRFWTPSLCLGLRIAPGPRRSLTEFRYPSAEAYALRASISTDSSRIRLPASTELARDGSR